MNDRTPFSAPANTDEPLSCALAELRAVLAELRPLVAEASALVLAVAARYQKIAEDV